jgi:hypothetical protein
VDARAHALPLLDIQSQGGAVMPGSFGNMLVTRAMDLWHKWPDRPALEILDRAMLGHRDEHPDFAHGGPLMSSDSHHLLPPAPFSELLRRAFAPELDAREVLLMALLRPPADPALRARLRAVESAWRTRVIEPFGARYRLWGGADPAHAADLRPAAPDGSEGAPPGRPPKPLQPEPPATDFSVPGLAP